MFILVFFGGFGVLKPDKVFADTTRTINPIQGDFGNPNENYNMFYSPLGFIMTYHPDWAWGYLKYDIENYNKGLGYIKCDFEGEARNECELGLLGENWATDLLIIPSTNNVAITIFGQTQYHDITLDINNYNVNLYFEYEYGQMKNGVIKGWITTKIFKVPKTGGTPELLYQETFNDLTFYDENQNPVVNKKIKTLYIGEHWWGEILQGSFVLTQKEYLELSIETPQKNDEHYKPDNLNQFVLLKLKNINLLDSPYGLVLLKVIDIYRENTYYWRTFWTYNDSGGFNSYFWLPADVKLEPGSYTIQAYFLPYYEYASVNLSDEEFISQAEENGLATEPVNFILEGFNTEEWVGSTPFPPISPYPYTPPELSLPPYAGTEEICETPPGGFLEYPVQNMTFAICKGFTFLFLPSENQRKNLADFLNNWVENLKKKPPFGYFYLVKNAFNSVDTMATTTEYNFEIPVIGDTLKQAIVFLFWLIAVAYVIFRIKTIL